jgi:hypothetical protein
MKDLIRSKKNVGLWLVPLGCAIACLFFIGPTLLPGVGFWDTAEFQTVPHI